MRNIITLALGLSLLACGKSDSPAKEAPRKPDPAGRSVPPPPIATAAKEKSCAELGGRGEGTFGDMCRLKKPAPFTVKILDTYKDAGRTCAFTNNSGQEVTWASIAGWYYDKDGQVIEVVRKERQPAKFWTANGSVFKFKAGETKEYECGWLKADEPKGATLEVEITGWGKDEPKEAYFQIDTNGVMYEQRPRGGFKS